jgi:hypothetical protein
MGFYSRWFQADVTEAAQKIVECEKCGIRYVYTMWRTGVGREISILHLENEQAKRLAEEYARKNVAETLAAECEPVPCPKCGWFQAPMIERAKEIFRLSVWRLGVVMLAIGFPFLLIGLAAEQIANKNPDSRARELVVPASIISLAGMIGGPAVLFWRLERKRKYNPNDVPQTDRIKFGRELALTLDEFNERGKRPPDSHDGRGSSGPG